MNGLPNKKEKSPHRIRACNRWGHKTWQGLRNPAEGHRDQNNMSGVVSVNRKNHHFADQSADSGWKEQTVDYIP
jgi:hypothetical protein